MSFKFSKRSLEKLETCHWDLQRLFHEVIKLVDCTILDGHRPQHIQDHYFKQGLSKTPWPESKHNSLPSLAVDVVPYPVIWPDKKNRPSTYLKDLSRLYRFVGIVEGIAQGLGIKIRVGADWDGDMDLTDQRFDDLPHFELIPD